MKYNKIEEVGKKIIIEGIDGAGKTHTIEEIIKNSDIDYKVVHCTRHTPNNFDYFIKLLGSEENIIFDRAMYGQFVYQTKEEREERGQLNLNSLLYLETIMKEINVKVIYVYSDIETCLYNCKKDSEDSYYTYDYLKSLDEKFRFLFSLSSLDITFKYNDYHPTETPQKVDPKSFDYSSLPKVAAVDFDGTLVVGEEFPKIGKLNQKLVDLLYKGKYKDYKKILFTHRSGQALIDACNFCADNGIYFDAINDDIPEVKEPLNRDAINNRKIWFDVLFDDKANLDEFI